jgi:hypothetical protein
MHLYAVLRIRKSEKDTIITFIFGNVGAIMIRKRYHELMIQAEACDLYLVILFKSQGNKECIG